MKVYTYLLIIIAAIAISSCGDGKTYVIIDTEYGEMKAELYESTPKHKENFIKLVKEGYYDDLLFHRIIEGFMIQGGDPDSRNAAKGARLGMGGPGYKIDAEIGAPHIKGALSAARQGGSSNPTKQSSGSQFYIVQGTKYTRFQLENIAKQKGITYNEEQIKQYEEKGGTPQLDMDYTVFGELVSGYDVLDKIAAVQKDGSDRPLEDVKMKISIAN